MIFFKTIQTPYLLKRAPKRKSAFLELVLPFNIFVNIELLKLYIHLSALLFIKEYGSSKKKFASF